MIIVPGGKRHFVRLRSGDKFHHPSTGHVLHEAVIGSPPGTVLKGRETVVWFACGLRSRTTFSSG